MHNQAATYTKSRFTSAVLYFELSLVTLLIVGTYGNFSDSLLDGLFATLLTCYFVLYPAAIVSEHKQLFTKDLLLFIMSFVAFGFAICYPWARSFYHYTSIDPMDSRAIRDILRMLNGFGQLLTFLTLLYNLYVWHRIANKRPAAKRFAFILWPRQMLVVAQIVLLGIPL